MYYNPSEAVVHIIPSLQVLYSKVVFLMAYTQLRGKAAENQFGVKFGIRFVQQCVDVEVRCVRKSWRNKG